MTLGLNNCGTAAGIHCANVELFSDGGSVCHMALGFLAGTDLFKPKDAVILLGAFAGYQISQANGGEPWGRIGGELLEFVIGMLLARLLPLLRRGFA